jgi:hypothetical protein
MGMQRYLFFPLDIAFFGLIIEGGPDYITTLTLVLSETVTDRQG